MRKTAQEKLKAPLIGVHWGRNDKILTMRLLLAPTAVDQNGLSGREVGSFGAEECDHAGDFLRFAQPTCRRSCGKRLRHFRRIVFQNRSGDNTRGYDVHLDVMFRIIHSYLTAHRNDGAFGSGITGETGQSAMGSERSDIDDLARTFLQHARQYSLHAEEDALHVNIHHAIELLFRKIDDVGRFGDACDSAERVHCAEFGFGFFH